MEFIVENIELRNVRLAYLISFLLLVFINKNFLINLIVFLVFN
jgi:hypothetical protein